MPQLSYEDAQSAIGQTLVDSNGEKVGKIVDVYFDLDTRQPEWLLVNSGMFGTKESFVPAVNARRTGEGMQAGYDKAMIKDAPRAEPDGDLSQDEEATLYSHYGLEYTEQSSDSGLAGGGEGKTQTPRSDRGETVAKDTSGRETDSAMTRSEEELSFNKVRRPSETMRLRKYITEENVSTTVPVERETLRVEREPITEANMGDAMQGADLTTEEAEIELSSEEVTVEKKVVPKERVRLDKDVEVEQREVSETVRKEQIDVEQGDEKPSKR